MANKYYFTACLKKDDNGGIVMDKRNRYFEAINDLIELHNSNNTLGNGISFIGIVKHKANENPLDRIRDLNENLTLDIYTRIVNAMDELRKTNIVSNNKVNGEDVYTVKRVKYNYNISFDIEAYYDKEVFSLLEFQIYLKRKGKYEDCCTLPSYFEKEQEEELRKFLNKCIN